MPDRKASRAAASLTGNTLTGLMAGNYFTASGTVNSNGTGSEKHDDD